MKELPQMLIVVLFIVTYCHALMLFDNKCDIMTNDGIPDDINHTINMTVEESCINGSIDWNYPRGHVLLNFPIIQTLMSTSVCIRDYLGGEVFEFTDVTEKTPYPLGHVHRDEWICTKTRHVADIVLKIDAPQQQRYMGAVEYMKRQTLNNSG